MVTQTVRLLVVVLVVDMHQAVKQKVVKVVVVMETTIHRTHIL
tara:strand:- start:80 stop:208 length:129 start_codon:yes stop_codon:yes gene_type:complete